MKHIEIPAPRQMKPMMERIKIRIMGCPRAKSNPSLSKRMIPGTTIMTLKGAIRNTFPSPSELVNAGETTLRELGLGFRAPYVDKVTRLVLEGDLNLTALIETPYPTAKEILMSCPGIGPKISDCILVFSLEKMEAFPIDVWIRRALGDWYFPGEKTPSNKMLQEWAQNYFGRYGGYAQQYLFHGRRLEK